MQFLQQVRSRGFAGTLLFFFLATAFIGCGNATPYLNSRNLHESAKNEFLSWRVLGDPAIACTRSNDGRFEGKQLCGGNQLPQWHVELKDYDLLDSVTNQNLLN